MTGLNRKILLFFLTFIATLWASPVCHAETLSRLFEKAYITPLKTPVKAHDFTLPTTRGGDIRLSDLRGRVVLLNIWAIWCGPCRHEMPSIEKLYQHFRGHDITILAVSVDMLDTELVRAFVEEHKYTFTVLHDRRGRIMESFSARLIPVTYLINGSGDIIGKAIGVRDWSQPAMIRLFEELLKETERK